MKRCMHRLSMFFTAAALLAACGAPPASAPEPPPTAAPIVSHGSQVTDYASLLAELGRAGAAVEPAGQIEQPFFPVKGQIIRVDGSDVQVFEYASEAEAETQAALVALDGGSIGTHMAAWLDTPNFFKAGRLIVLYVGADALTLDHLAQVLGLQFAGGPFAAQGAAPDEPVSVGGGMPLPAADAAVKALAAARGIPAGQITVISAEAVEWPDACLGVSQPGQMCAQVITPGYRVSLQAGAEQFEVHTDEFGSVVVFVP